MTVISVYHNRSVTVKKYGEYRLFYNHTTNLFYGSFVKSAGEEEVLAKRCAAGLLMAYQPHERWGFAKRLDGIKLSKQYEV